MPVVLIVDDEAANRELLRYILSLEHEVVLAQNGEDGLALLSEKRPDLVIIDLYMPGMNGTEFIKRVRNAEGEIARTRIALYTGTQSDAAMRDFMAVMRIEHVIPKPGEPHEIIAAVRSALD